MTLRLFFFGLKVSVFAFFEFAATFFVCFVFFVVSGAPRVSSFVVLGAPRGVGVVFVVWGAPWVLSLVVSVVGSRPRIWRIVGLFWGLLLRPLLAAAFGAVVLAVSCFVSAVFVGGCCINSSWRYTLQEMPSVFTDAMG